MSGLSALASYDISDDEDVERDSGDEGKKEEQKVESDPKVKQEIEKPTIPDEDIWDPDEEIAKKDEDEEEEKNQEEEGEDEDSKAGDDSIKDFEDLSAVHEGSEEEQEEGGESSGGENEGADSLGEVIKVTAKRRSKRSSSENAMNLAKKLRTSSIDEVSIPPEPEGRCSSSLQDKIKRFMERKVKDGEDLNRAIHARKDFRNPSIYEKLILYLSIDELGTNFPKEDYDPKIWRKAPAYDELARAQREDIAKREKERKTKVEFVTGTVKKPSAASSSQPSSSSDSVKKTKWDQQTFSKTSGDKKPTVISAVGSIKKPKV